LVKTRSILAGVAVAALAGLTLAGLTLAVPQPATAAGRASAAPLASTAAKQPVVQGFFEGKTIRYFDYGAIRLRPGNKVAPIWSVTNGAAGQHDIVDAVPGDSGYTPLRRVVEVTWAAGKTPRLLKSAVDVRRAKAAGAVTLKTTATVANSAVLGFGQTRITGFSAGRQIRYHDLGPAKVAPGNAVVPLYAVVNGVAGQHNVTGDTVAPGQTAYPPLWGIWEVTWKPGATKRLLTSFAAIQKAKAAGDVTVAKTSLVVNCPVVT
jgi:hypothetical protein